MTNNEISSISDLLRILTELGEAAEGRTRFFRGQGKADWEILPGIYRNQKLVENEDKIIKEALLNCPDDFLPTDTLLEKLVKLQHYSYPTRLLDLTMNALVGLYFACSNTEHHDKDGELIILDIPDQDIKYDDSDTVAILVALSLLNLNFDLDRIRKDSYCSIPTKFMQNNFVDEENKESIEKVFMNNPIFDRIRNDWKINFEDWYSEYMEEKEIKKIVKQAFNEHEEILKLLSIIKEDKSGFLPIIYNKDLEKVLCVRAKLNNSRISRQQGAFLVFGIKKSKLSPSRIPTTWQLKINNNKIIVKADHKANILKELRSFGISKQILFPELESQASEIIDQYKNQLKRN